MVRSAALFVTVVLCTCQGWEVWIEMRYTHTPLTSLDFRFVIRPYCCSKLTAVGVRSQHFLPHITVGRS